MTTHFSLEELIQSDIALRQGIDNRPSKLVLDNLLILLAGLESVRAVLNQPMFITSGYRSPTLNRFIGGVSTSAHCLGYAADFKCPQFGSPYAIVKAIKASGIKYDQLINEGTWVHISFDRKLRQQTLTANFVKGKAVYGEFRE